MATKYCDKAGSDSNDGLSEVNAKLTFAGLIAIILAGDVGQVGVGAYAEAITLSTAGTSGSPISYISKTGDTVTLTGDAVAVRQLTVSGAYTTWDGIDVPIGVVGSGTNYVVGYTAANCEFKNATIEGVSTYKADYDAANRVGGIQVTASDFLAENATLNNIVHIGINLNQASVDSVLSSVTVANSGSHCVVCQNSSGTNVDFRVVAKNCNLSGSYTSDSFQTAKSGVGNVRKIVVRDSILKNSEEDGFDGKSSEQVLLEGCYVYGVNGDNNGSSDGNDRNSEGTVKMTSSGQLADHWIIRYNVIYDNFSGIAGSSGTSSMHYYNNTILNNTRDYTGSNSTFTNLFAPFGFGRSAWSGTRNAFKNNIVGYHGTKYEVVIRIESTTIDEDNNLFVGSSPQFGIRTGSTYVGYNLAGWKTNSLLDANSTETNSPDFENVTSTVNGDHNLLDFRIKTTSPAYQSGAHLTLANGAGATSTALTVDDSEYFYDGWAITGEVADTIYIGSTSVLVSSINYGTDVITLATTQTWADNDQIFQGSATPHKGALSVASSSTFVTRLATVFPDADATVVSAVTMSTDTSSLGLSAVNTEPVVDVLQLKFSNAGDGLSGYAGAANQSFSVDVSFNGSANNFKIGIRYDNAALGAGVAFGSETALTAVVSPGATSNQIKLVNVVAGAPQTIASADFTFNLANTYTFLPKFDGTTATLSIDGVQKLSAVTSTITTGKYIYFKHQDAVDTALRIDNLTVQTDSYAAPASSVVLVGGANFNGGFTNFNGGFI